MDDRLDLDLPSQALTRSIIALGKAGKISIVVPSYLLNGLEAPSLKAEISLRDALQVLLEGTSLRVKEINQKVIAIVPLEDKPVVDKPYSQSLEEILIIGQQVTGSFLTRTDLQGSAPIDIITRYELNVSGAQSIAEFLKFIPAVSGNSTSTAISNGGNGTATVTLRGLPANNTLVLINGKRVATEGLNGVSVDLNTIPSAAVERIEIYKDGASAVYGSDAIAGVINIIMKREYDGLLLEQYFGSSYRNDIETKFSHIMAGKTFDRASFLFSAQLFEQNPLFSRDRSISRSADGRAQGGIDKRSTSTVPATVRVPERDAVILREGARGESPEDFRPVTQEDRFDYQSQNSSISPSKRKNLYSSGVFSLTDAVTLSVDGSFNESDARVFLASTPIFTANQDPPILVASDNIYNPFEVDILDARRRVIELGPRLRRNVARAKRASITLEGYDDTIEWELGTYWSRVDVSEHIDNLLNLTRLRRALGPARECVGIDIDGCQPLNIFGPAGSISETQLNYIKTRDSRDGYSQLAGLGGNVSASLADLPAGPLLAAVGFDLRQEEINSIFRSETPGESALGGVLQSSTIGSRNSTEFFFESNIPIFRQEPLAYSLELELAARHSRYSDFESNTSPKLGLRYRPVQSFMIRSTYSEGFRTPSLGELYAGREQSQLLLTDPCSIEANVGLPGCPVLTDEGKQQILTTFEGQSELSAESSDSHTFGFVWTPKVRGDLYLSIDRFDIDQENVVDQDAELILDRNARFNEFPGLVIRDESGTVTNLISPYFNIGEKRVSGVDTSLRYSLQSQKFGRFTYSFNASYLERYEFQLSENAPLMSLAGKFRDVARDGEGALPRWKANTGIYWSNSHWELNYSINYIHHLRDIAGDSFPERELESWITHDTQLAFRTGNKPHVKFVFGIDNIWNRKPPFSVSAFNDNYDARTYDIKGQFLYGKILFGF